MNKKGISLVSLVIMIIIIIILATIVLNVSMNYITTANETKFKTELEDLVNLVDVYNKRAIIYNKDYDSSKLSWDGKSDRAENTAKIENIGGDTEDSIRTIFQDYQIPKDIEGIIYIENGQLKVREDAVPQYDWAIEVYEYMKVAE